MQFSYMKRVNKTYINLASKNDRDNATCCSCSTVSLACPHLGQLSYSLHPRRIFILPTPQHSLSHLESHFFLDVSAPFAARLRLFQSISDSSFALNFFRELIQYCLIASLWINFVKVVFSCDPIFI